MPPSPICCRSLYGPMIVPEISTGGWSMVGELRLPGAGTWRKLPGFACACRSTSTRCRKAMSAPQASARKAAHFSAACSRTSWKICSSLISLTPGPEAALQKDKRDIGPASTTEFPGIFRSGPAADFRLQPGLGKDPVTIRRAGRNPQDVRCLVPREPGKVPQLDKLRLHGVVGSELVESL